MWFYELDHKPQGPIDIEMIKQLLAAGTINATTLVWREGMSVWVPLQKTELAEVWLIVQPDAQTATPPLPTTANLSFPARVKPSTLQKLLVWWLVLQGIGIVYYLLNQILPKGSIQMSLVCVFEIPIVATAVLQFVLLFHLWQVVQDGFARTSPAKAIGFLFIPVFNIYWNFQAYFGLAKDLNRYMHRHFENNPDVSLYKTHPFISLISILISYVTVGFSFYEIGRTFISSLASHSNSAAYTNSIQTYSLPFFIIAIVNIIFVVTMFLDDYLAAKSILMAEKAR